MEKGAFCYFFVFLQEALETEIKHRRKNTKQSEDTVHELTFPLLGYSPEDKCTQSQLTLFHHADVDAALETTGLAVAPVVLGDGAAPVERAGEGGFALHAAPAGGKCHSVHYASGGGLLLVLCIL